MSEFCPENTVSPNEHNWVASRATGRSWCKACGEPAPEVVRIHRTTDLYRVYLQLGVRPDWHEPDEQDVTAHVGGHCFDNAGFWPESNCSQSLRDAQATEMYVELRKDGLPIAQVNLATLFAIACGTVDE